MTENVDKTHVCTPDCWSELPLFRGEESAAPILTPAVFLDRDNTLIADPGYINDPSLVRLLPGAAEALAALAAGGFKLVVVSNQSGVARGMLTEPTLAAIHEELRRQLADQSVALEAIYYCPFHPEGTVPEYTRESDLRKPAPGMLLLAASEHHLDLAASWMIGDSPRDVEAGRRAGCRTILVRTKAGSRGGGEMQPDYVASNLAEAARVVLHGATAEVEAVSPSDTEAEPSVSEGVPVAAEVPHVEQAAQVVSEPPVRAADCGNIPAAQVSNVVDNVVAGPVASGSAAACAPAASGSAAVSARFSVVRFLSGMLPVLALLAAAIGGYRLIAESAVGAAVLWAIAAVVLAATGLAFWAVGRNR